MLWIYNLPTFVTGLLIVSLMVAAALSGHRLWRRCFAWECTAENSGLAIGMLAVVAMLLSLLLAFSSVTVWETYTGAESSAVLEAGVAGELVRDLAVFGGPQASAAREAVRDYLSAVIADEWPAMAKGGNSDNAANKFNDIFRRAGQIVPRTPREEILLAEIWGRTNELNLHRRGRLEAAGGSAVPNELWGTLLTAILINFLLFYVVPVTRLNELALGLYAAMLGLMLFFIIVMDRPFAGTVNVSPAPYETALRSMKRWDGTLLPAAPGQK